MYTTLAYTSYILCSIAITVFVSRTLSKNGEIYLIDGFDGDQALAKSVNHMLVVGFYLLNLGVVLLRMEGNGHINNPEDLLIYLSGNIGMVLLILGCMHFFNMYVIHRFRADKSAPKKESFEIDQRA